ncbi:PREDICTED: cadherin-like protein 26 [Thamnophis sirtalis]|uniref:Cadherin-like protein 26 n=1 Tax=Thamnophis sirtalis TaxID=35019 RepID=A0A6I9YGE0_9SAUR|nr:PREDICTED: cadherin-like protein 26 [Thamnophis sirtalis]
MLVTTSLTICEGDEMGPFHIKAEDKDSYPFAEPFMFKLEDALEGTEKFWTLGESSDNSVELLILKSLPPGEYFVPLLIQDLQGFSRQQTLDLQICSCPDGITCEERTSLETASLGINGGAIGAIVAAFLLLLLGLALLVLCSCLSKVKKAPTFIPYEAGIQTLIHYNEESEHTLNAPDSGNQATLSSVHGQNVKQTQHVCENVPAVIQMKPIENHQNPNGNVTSPFNTIKAWNQLESLNHQNIQTYQRNPHEKISEIVAIVLKQKCEDMANLEDDRVSYVPRVYAREGALEKNESSWSLFILEDDKNSLPEDFLGVLEPRFIPLAKICSE